MTDNEIIDAFLKALYDIDPKSKSLETFLPDERRRCQRIESSMIKKELVIERDTLVAGQRPVTISRLGIDIIEKHGSYSLYLKSREKENQNKKTDTKINRAGNIVSIIASIIAVFSFGWGVYKDVKYDQLKTENHKLELFTDSLQKELEIMKPKE